MKKYVLNTIICFIAFAIYHIFFVIVIYFIPLYHYEKLITKKNLTKKEVDKTLFMYYKLETSFKTFRLNHITHTHIKENEYFVRYLMLGFPSIDAIYDKNDNLVWIFDTYE